jgi:hypothetical protein
VLSTIVLCCWSNSSIATILGPPNNLNMLVRAKWPIQYCNHLVFDRAGQLGYSILNLRISPVITVKTAQVVRDPS